MKVRVKKTGEVFLAKEYAEVAVETYDSMGDIRSYGLDEIEIIPDAQQAAETPAADWEKRRYEVAKDLLSAFVSSYRGNLYSVTPAEHAERAIYFADELIKKLKGGEQ